MAPGKQICTATDDEMFCYSITTDNNGNVIYSDLAGKFPIESYVYRYELLFCLLCLQVQLRYGKNNDKQKGRRYL